MGIRKFRNSDAKELTLLRQSTIKHINKKDYSPNQIKLWSKSGSVERLKKAAKINQVFVSVENGKITGFISYNKNKINGLYIHKNFTRRGMGKKLLKKIESHAYKNGIRTFNCNSTITAHKFYESNGFKTIKKTNQKMNDQNLTVYEMKKRLIPNLQ